MITNPAVRRILAVVAGLALFMLLNEPRSAISAQKKKKKPTAQFAPSPVGGKLLMLTGERLFLVDTSSLDQLRPVDPAKDKAKKKL